MSGKSPLPYSTVRPSLPGSYERLFHDVGLPAFVARLSSPAVASVLAGPRLERAIGVIYRPETERGSHYFAARLPLQFDLVVHVDRTRGVEPLERWTDQIVDLPETYPTGDEDSHGSTCRVDKGWAGTHRRRSHDSSQGRRALVVFSHGSGSSRFSRRNRSVAQVLHTGGYATLLLDLLTRQEDATDEQRGRYPL